VSAFKLACQPIWVKVLAEDKHRGPAHRRLAKLAETCGMENFAYALNEVQKAWHR
jgi:hypothetical protein